MTEKDSIIYLLEEKGINIKKPIGNCIRLYKTDNDRVIAYFTDIGEYIMGYVAKVNGKLKPLMLFSDLEKEIVNINERTESHDYFKK
jgi:hypothetical protein